MTLPLGVAGAAPAAADNPIAYKIVTASPSGTYYQIGRDLGAYVAPQANVALSALTSAGSVENVRRLRYEPGVKLALVQSDVHQAYLDEAANGNEEARALVTPLRLVMPLYNEEIYLIVRADSPLNYVHEIGAARINIGPAGSGTAMTARTLYRLMFHKPIDEPNVSSATSEDALGKLVTDRSVDVVFVVAGQPAKLLADMKPEARRLVKLLKVDRANATNASVLQTYFPATVLGSNYPNLLSQDLPAFAVKSLLVTYDYRNETSVTHLVRFARSLCQNFATLQANGHPKWREVRIALPDLGRGWSYFAPTENELRACPARQSQSACSPEQKALGLCK